MVFKIFIPPKPRRGTNRCTWFDIDKFIKSIEKVIKQPKEDKLNDQPE